MALGQTNSGCLQLMVECDLRAEYEEEKNEFLLLQGGPQEMSGRIFLTKRDGNVNGFQYGALKGALDWDGKDIADLQNLDFSKKKVAIHVVEDEYQGKISLKIDAISNLDWTPGYGPATGQDLDKIKSAWAATKPKKEEVDDPNELPPDSDIPF